MALSGPDETRILRSRLRRGIALTNLLAGPVLTVYVSLVLGLSASTLAQDVRLDPYYIPLNFSLLILIWVALDMWGVSGCSMSGSMLGRIKIKGMIGAFVLGLAYGILSGSCTFGFIAPILAFITIEQKIMIGIVYILLFGIGHCIPIAVAGSSTAKVKKLLESSSFHEGSLWFKKCAGAAIAALGLYFVIRPFIDIS